MTQASFSHDHPLIKSAATVFVTVVAPLLVAWGVKLSDRVADVAKADDRPKSQTPAISPAAAPPTVMLPTVSAPTAASQVAPSTASLVPGNNRLTASAAQPQSDPPALTEPAAAMAVSPMANLPLSQAADPPAADQPLPPAAERRVGATEIKLFNGVDLSGFYTWLDAPQKHFGKNKDPGHVFAVKDGVLRISGKCTGGLVTASSYSNYHLRAEYRWTGPTWPPREQRARSSGVLLHCVGDDGAIKGTWMQSVKCCIIEGGTGDLKVMSPDAGHPVSMTIPAEAHVTGTGSKQRLLHCYKPGGSPIVFNAGFVKRFPSSPWQDVVGFRGANELEEPVGEWNLLECICDEDRITVRLNGHTVNEASHCSQRRGKIMLQSNGAAIEFRSVNLSLR